MTRTEIKQAAKDAATCEVRFKQQDALIAADELIDKLEARVSELETDKAKLREAMQWFVNLCECGDARRRRTYARFKELLKDTSDE